MFLTRSGFKRLMANAYKGDGLRVRNNGQGISITGSTWAAFFLAGEIPKETLGDLIAMVGELPAKYECYTAGKSGNQMEIWDDAIMTAMDIANGGGKDLACTCVRIDDFPYSTRVLQSFNGEITLVDDTKMAVIQLDLINADDDEKLPEGPVLSVGNIIGAPVKLVCWSNNRMAFCMMPIIPNDKHVIDIITEMEKIDL